MPVVGGVSLAGMPLVNPRRGRVGEVCHENMPVVGNISLAGMPLVRFYHLGRCMPPAARSLGTNRNPHTGAHARALAFQPPKDRRFLSVLSNQPKLVQKHTAQVHAACSAVSAKPRRTAKPREI